MGEKYKVDQERRNAIKRLATTGVSASLCIGGLVSGSSAPAAAANIEDGLIRETQWVDNERLERGDGNNHTDWYGGLGYQFTVNVSRAHWDDDTYEVEFRVQSVLTPRRDQHSELEEKWNPLFKHGIEITKSGGDTRASDLLIGTNSKWVGVTPSSSNSSGIPKADWVEGLKDGFVTALGAVPHPITQAASVGLSAGDIISDLENAAGDADNPESHHYQFDVSDYIYDTDKLPQSHYARFRVEVPRDEYLELTIDDYVISDWRYGTPIRVGKEMTLAINPAPYLDPVLPEPSWVSVLSSPSLYWYRGSEDDDDEPSACGGGPRQRYC